MHEQPWSACPLRPRVGGGLNGNVDNMYDAAREDLTLPPEVIIEQK